MRNKDIQKRPKEEVRQKILVAAEQLFASNGYSGTTIREIADKAGVNSAMIYYYFENKLGLYESIVDISSGETYRMLLKAFKGGGDPAQQLRNFCVEYSRAHYHNRDIVKIIHRELLTDGNDSSGFANRYFRKSLEAVKDILRAGVDAGRFKEVDLDLAGTTIFGLILLIFMSEPLFLNLRGIEGLDEAVVIKITEEMMEILFAGIVKGSVHTS